MIFLTFLMSVPVTENEEVTVLARQPGAPYVFYKEAQEEEISQVVDSDLEDTDPSQELSKGEKNQD